MQILGLHHVTATVDDAQDDLDFCLGALGLRLVKKTVNFDNHHVYHFYYGNARGTPGTIWTTFPYKGHGVRVGSKGAGQVTVTSFSVPTGALGAWRKRLEDVGVDVAEHPEADPATNGLGTVHHVAMAIGTAEEQLAIREELIRYGCKVTEVRDRCYFTSIYFREPGGVLFEIATMAPGFAIDEALPDLGRALKLPPWEEPYRADIESALAPVTD